MKKWLILFLLFCCYPCFAWDATGHRLVAQIAYEQLDTQTIIRINQLLGAKHSDISSRYLLSASEWPDAIKQDGVTAFNDWHFINIPFSTDGMPLLHVPKENIVWAIGQCMQVLESQKASYDNKKLFLRLLIHFVGDIEQPLHCATKISKANPAGDEGGNLFPLALINTPNLHEFWDEGAGFFANGYANYPLRYWQIKQLAKQIEQAEPMANFQKQLNDSNYDDWANASFMLAKKDAYAISENSKPTAAYIKQSQQIVEQQIALAGYRLAQLLKQIAAENADN